MIATFRKHNGDGFSISLSEDFDRCVEVICVMSGVPHLFILCLSELEQLKSYKSVVGIWLFAKQKELSPTDLQLRIK